MSSVVTFYTLLNMVPVWSSAINRKNLVKRIQRLMYNSVISAYRRISIEPAARDDIHM